MHSVRSATRRGAVRIIGVALATALIIGTMAVPAGARKHLPVPKPPEWADRVLPLVHFVERNRGFEFDRPIKVSLLSNRAFAGRFGGDFVVVDPLVKQYVGRLRALGLISADYRISDLESNGSAQGFFDSYLQEVVIRGKDLHDPGVLAVLVHELAHALVDQHFRRHSFDNVEYTFAVQALVEGDATAVEAAYIRTLAPQQRTRVHDSLFGGWPTTEPLLDVLGTAPYVLGGRYIEVLEALGTRDDAFRDPPHSDNQIIDPLGDGIGKPSRFFSFPAFAAAEFPRGDPGELGQLLVFLTLAARIDVELALRAALGWDGDRYQGFKVEDDDCLRVTVRGVTPTDANELVAAFDAWARTRPLGAAVITAQRHGVLVRACESAGPVTIENDLAESVGLVLGGRLLWASRALRHGEPQSVAQCAGDAMAVAPDVIGAERVAGAFGRRYGTIEDAGRAVVESRFAIVVADCHAASNA